MTTAPEPTASTHTPWWIGGALLLAVLAIFGQTYHHAFLDYDDKLYITENAMVLRGLTLEGLRWSLGAIVASLWHPVTMISHMVAVQLFGLHAGLHHLLDVALHGLNAVLVFLALRRLTGATWRSAAVAALFAVHPLRVESVAWASERKDLLSGLFFLLALCAYARYVRTRARRSFALLVVWFVLGLASKPMVVTLPFVLLLLDQWPLRRDEPARALVLEKLPLFVIAVGASAVTVWTQNLTGALGSVETFPIGARIANALVAYAEYVGQTFAPIHLAVMYPHPRAHIAWGTVAFAAAAVGGITIATAAVWRKHPYALIGWLWFVGMLVPVIGLVQVGSSAHADRYTYLPHIGLLVAVVWTAAEVARTARLPRWALPCAAVAASAALAVLCFAQVRHWRDTITLFEHTVRISPDSGQAHVNLGAAYLRSKRPDLAAVEFRRTLEIDPGAERAKVNLGAALIELKRPAEAAGLFEQLIDADGRNSQYHVMLAVALCDQGRVDEAILRAQEALRIEPGNPRARAVIDRCRTALPAG